MIRALKHALISAQNMSREPRYTADAEFQKLIARSPDVDLTVAALEIARDAYPELDFEQTLDWIAARGRDLSGVVARAKTEMDALKSLAECIAEQHGIYGSKEAYSRADSSFLNWVIEHKRGIPISLSLLYMAVADRVGLELQGVAAPLHFLTRYESADGPLFIDAYARGRILKHDECANWIGEIAKLDRKEAGAALRPATPRTIVIRMLNNLKALYAQQEEWLPAWKVQHRLTALQPASYQERRDLALISLKANRPGPAVDLLEASLAVCPKEERDVLESQLTEAKNQLSRWN
jgi:regulator of sirC expression with transglutaminase-like and TPR domain